MSRTHLSSSLGACATTRTRGLAFLLMVALCGCSDEDSESGPWFPSQVLGDASQDPVTSPDAQTAGPDHSQAGETPQWTGGRAVDAGASGTRTVDAGSGLQDSGPARAHDAGIVQADAAATETSGKASPGCGKSGRPAQGEVRVSGDHIYRFPAHYDGSTPLPVVFAFHAHSNPIDQILTITRGTDLADNYVMVFPKSVGAGWSKGVDKPRFEGWMRDLLDNYCVDESALFATGHSSGAQFVVQLLCDGESRFRAVAPVAASAYCSRHDPIPALVIHGANDRERAQIGDADGRKDLAPYLESNSCQTTTSPHPAMACTSNSNRAPVNAGCRSYQGCSLPVVWCQHDDISYGTSNHGWPCFATQAMFDFFETFR